MRPAAILCARRGVITGRPDSDWSTANGTLYPNLGNPNRGGPASRGGHTIPGGLSSPASLVGPNRGGHNPGLSSLGHGLAPPRMSRSR